MRKTLIAGTALMVLGAFSPMATAADSTGVTTLSATVGTNVSVTGTAAFVDVPVVVGTDEDGASPNGIGADIRELSISRPIPGNNLVFKMAIDDFAAPGALPNVVYLWPLMVNAQDNQLFLMAGRAGGFPNASADPGFAVMQNTPDGFLPVADVTGSLGNGAVTWTVPLGSLGAKVGNDIELGSGAPPSARFGVHQIVWLGSPVFDSFSTEEIYSVPGNSVRIGIAPAGTAPEAVALTATAPVTSSGGFAGSLPKPATPGDYVVVAQACFGPLSCGLSSTTVTVA